MDARLGRCDHEWTKQSSQHQKSGEWYTMETNMSGRGGALDETEVKLH